MFLIMIHDANSFTESCPRNSAAAMRNWQVIPATLILHQVMHCCQFWFSHQWPIIQHTDIYAGTKPIFIVHIFSPSRLKVTSLWLILTFWSAMPADSKLAYCQNYALYLACDHKTWRDKSHIYKFAQNLSIFPEIISFCLQVSFATGNVGKSGWISCSHLKTSQISFTWIRV